MTGLLIILIISISSEGDGVLVKCITIGTGSDGESWTVTDMDRLELVVARSWGTLGESDRGRWYELRGLWSRTASAS